MFGDRRCSSTTVSGSRRRLGRRFIPESLLDLCQLRVHPGADILGSAVSGLQGFPPRLIRLLLALFFQLTLDFLVLHGVIYVFLRLS